MHRVVANDPDIAPILRYRIDPNSSEARNEEGTLIKIQEYDYLSLLELNALDGLLRVVKLIDRERVETIRLGLVVEDLGAIRGLQTAFGGYLNNLLKVDTAKFLRIIIIRKENSTFIF